MTQLHLIVTEIEDLSPLIKRFRFEDPGGAPLPRFSGGAHVTLDLPGDTPGALRRNSYSLISDPEDSAGYEIAVRRDDAGRGGSRYLHQQLARGDAITLSWPRNMFALDLRARKHLLIGGGIGITPFLSQIAQLEMGHYPYELHYAVPDRASAAALPLLPETAPLHLHLSDAGTRMDLAAILADQPLGTHVYTCGPAALITAVADQAAQLGWPTSAVHSETFAAPPPGAPFEVVIRSTGQRVQVGATQSLLEALEAAGIEPDYSCRGGACGRCETGVSACDGQILHADHWLDPETRAAQTKIMPCMSRFQGARLELDL